MGKKDLWQKIGKLPSKEIRHPNERWYRFKTKVCILMGWYEQLSYNTYPDEFTVEIGFWDRKESYNGWCSVIEWMQMDVCTDKWKVYIFSNSN